MSRRKGDGAPPVAGRAAGVGVDRGPTAGARSGPSRSRPGPARALAGATVLTVVALAASAGGPGRLAAQQAPGVGSGDPGTVDPLLPDTILAAADRPALLLLPAPEEATVTLRISVPLSEAPAEAGAGRLLVDLGLDRARAVAGPVSARIDGGRTPEGVAWSVTGAVEDLDYLAYLLRVATAEPRPGRVDFQRARSALLEEVRRTTETPSGRVGRLLRDRAFPDTPPLGGTVGSLEAMTPGTLRDLWLRTHRPSRMTLLVVGDVPRELLLLSMGGMGAPAGAEAPEPPDRTPAPGEVDVEVLRRWFGEARVLSDPRDPRGQVAALLVAAHMRRVATSFEAHVELWQADGQRALAVMGAAYAAEAGTMRSGVREALAAAAGGLTESGVTAAVTQVRRETLFDARTPWGRADVVGRHLAATGDGAAARAWVDALDAVTVDSMRTYLLTLAEQTPVQTEVTP